MKKTLISLLLAFTFVFSTTAAVFAVDDTGIESIKKSPVIVKPMVDDTGL